jgi:KipI family sensor histidine kinase inhibitor
MNTPSGARRHAISSARVLDVGPLARLVEVAPGTAAAWAAALRAHALPGVVDVVPAARTVLVRCADAAAADAVASRVPHIDAAAADLQPTRRVVEIPVVYDGDDLDDVARATGLGPDEVIARHTGSSFRVEFCGFAPGFAYLAGLDEALRLPRRTTPRTRVPAGSVAIASAYSAVYPGVSPGGWHLLGSTPTRVWDVDRDPPALLEPGTAVRFVAVGRAP